MRAHRSIDLGLAVLALTAQVCHGKMPTFGASVGLGEYAVLGQPTAAHAGLYPCWGLYASFRVHERLSIVPPIAVEGAPETGQWGFIPSLTLDVPVHNRVGVDAIVMLMHNQTGNDWARAEVLLGLGPGISVYLGDWSIAHDCDGKDCGEQHAD